jgi:hypothetical protein
MGCARKRAGCTNPDGSECLVCPYAFACPSCHAGPGRRCVRPSGHDCTIHEPRVLIADAIALRDYREHVESRMTAREIRRWQARVADVAPAAHANRRAA